jgi:hypothetical protein
MQPIGNYDHYARRRSPAYTPRFPQRITRSARRALEPTGRFQRTTGISTLDAGPLGRKKLVCNFGAHGYPWVERDSDGTPRPADDVVWAQLGIAFTRGEPSARSRNVMLGFL